MSQTNRVIVVRVRGLPRDHSIATTLLKAAIDDPTGNYKATIVPSCDRSNESVALVDFKQKLPTNLVSLELDRLTSWQISVSDEDLSFDQNFLGFTQLYPTSETIQADIVAVCGVDGHAYGSWQGRGPLRRMWLRHFLCKDLPSCRTMIYGYKAKLSSKDSATAEDYAKDFLEALSRIRQNVPANRPIIFIAHSFGGLVIARAMVKLKQASAIDEVLLASIYQSIGGLLFFAVPFRGIDIEDMSRIMDAQNHPRASLLKQFAIGSDDLKKQLAEFIDVLYGLKVVSFFETESSRRLIRNDSGEWQRSGEFFTTLEAENAVLNLPREIETRIALHSDHSGIVKFDDKYDAGYEYAIKFLGMFLENANKRRLNRHKFPEQLNLELQGHRTRDSSMDDTALQQSSGSELDIKGMDNTWQFTTLENALYNKTPSKNNRSSRVQRSRAQSRSKEDDDCLAQLMVTDPCLDKKRIQETKGGILKDSYYWIVENEQYNRWHDSPSDNLLWIRGDPGKGKTMLLCGIIDEFGKTQSLAYFFCQATDSRLNDATSVLRGLTYMLADRNPSAMGYLRQKFQRGGIPEGPNAWWALCDILEAIFKELQSIHLLVDALDECGSGRDELIRFIRQASSSTEYQAKWIVSSRNWPDIKSSLHGVSNLSLELNSESVSSAVVYYIHYKVFNLAVKKSYDDGTRDHILNYLLTNAKGTFLWVALACANLEKSKSWNARRAIAMFPPDLEQMYEGMMQFIRQSDDSEYHQRVLLIVTNLYRPIFPEELQTLVNLPKEVTDNAISFKDFVDDCGSFLTIQDNRIELVHQSAKDYLDKYFCKQGITMSQTLHLNILERSISEMSRVLKRDNYGLKDPSLDVFYTQLPVADHLQGICYACIYWFEHLKTLRPEYINVHLVDLLYNFIKDKFLHWLEFVSLSHSVQYAITLLHEFKIHIELHEELDALRDLVHDSYRFAQFFRPCIAYNPLQIYVSGVLFCPKQSAYKEQLIRQKPSWLEIQLQEDNSWTPLVTKIESERVLPFRSIVYSCDSKRILTRDRRGDELRVWDTISGDEIGKAGIQSNTLSDESSVDSESIIEHKEDDLDDMDSQLVEHDRSSSSASEDQYAPLLSADADLTFAPGNHKVYYISKQGFLMSWNIETGEHLLLTDLNFFMYLRALSSDGKHVAYIMNGEVLLYKIDLQTDLSLSKGQPDLFEVLAFSSNGVGLCASSSGSRTVIWDVSAEKVVGSVDVACKFIDSLAVSNDLKLLLTASEVEELLVVTTVQTGSTIWSFNWMYGITFSYDSQKLAGGTGFYLHIHKISDSNSIDTLTDCRGPIAFSPDNKNLAYGTYTGFWSVDLSEVDGSDHTKGRVNLRNAHFSDTFSRFAVERGENFELWDLEHGCLMLEQVGELAQGGSGNCIVAWVDKATKPMVWRLNETSVEISSTVPDFGTCIASIFLAPDDTRALVGTEEPRLFIWDLRTNTFKPVDATDAYSINYDPLYRNISWDSSVDRVAFPTPHDTAYVIDVNSRDVLLYVHATVLAQPYLLSEIHLSPSGKTFACLDSVSSVAVWDVASRKQTNTFEISYGHSVRPTFCVSKDDRYLAIIMPSSLEFFNISTNSLLRKFEVTFMMLLVSVSQSGADTFIRTSRGLIVIKNDKIVMGTGDYLYIYDSWLCRDNKKLIWLPSQFSHGYMSDGKGTHAMEKQNGGLLIFKTQFDLVDSNDI